MSLQRSKSISKDPEIRSKSDENKNQIRNGSKSDDFNFVGSALEIDLQLSGSLDATPVFVTMSYQKYNSVEVSMPHILMDLQSKSTGRWWIKTMAVDRRLRYVVVVDQWLKRGIMRRLKDSLD